MEQVASERIDRRRGGRAAHAIYISIIVLGVIVAYDDTDASNREVIASIIGAAVLTALAELYADYVGTTISNRRHLTREEWRGSVQAIGLGMLMALLPLTFFILSALDVIKLSAAFDAAAWTGVGVLGMYAITANRLAGFSWRASILVGLGFTAVGAILVLLKVVF
jgi:hypothetical protein